jgi:hypothetical protein
LTTSLCGIVWLSLSLRTIINSIFFANQKQILSGFWKHSDCWGCSFYFPLSPPFPQATCMQKTKPCLQNNQSKKDWRYGSTSQAQKSSVQTLVTHPSKKKPKITSCLS